MPSGERGHSRTLIDDRGHLVEVIPPDRAPDGDDSGPGALARYRERLEPYVTILLVAAAFGCLGAIALTRFTPLSWWVAWAIATLPFFGLILAYMQLAGGRSPVPESWMIHQIVASGNCPACGSPLCDVEPDDDHMLVCPGCAGSWRDSRLLRPRAPGDPDRRRGSRANFRRLPHLLRTPRVADHLGQMTEVQLVRPRSRFVGDYERRCLMASRAIQTHSIRPRLLWTLASLAVGAVILVLFVLLTVYARAPLWTLWLFLPMAVSVLVAYVVWGGATAIPPATIETDTLARGLCPTCWELLAGVSPDPDGLTHCAECGSAWRLPPATADDEVPASCRACGYDLHGLDPDDRGAVTCPECGDVWIR